MEPQSLILVVDDQSRSRIALASLLEPEGYRVVYAENGPEALTQLRLLAPDLVLLDVMMPDMDGFEVCRHIRANPALAGIPVVMITALDDQESLLQGIEAGADDFVTKPFNRAELRARVRTITRLNRFRALLDQQRTVASERAQFLWAIERSDDGYLLLDEAGCPQDGNRQGWRYLGIAHPPDCGLSESFAELAGRHYQLVPADAWACWPEPAGVVRYLVRPEGAHAALWLQVDLLNLPGGVAGRQLVHLQDVSLKISAQRNIWEFQSFVSHKLRTPLTSVLTGMGLLHQRVDVFPEDLVMLIETAYGGAQRLKAVVDDIFRYLDAPITRADGEGAAILRLPDLAARLGAELGIAAMEVVSDLGHDDRRLAVSERTVEMLLTEILENACKFHPSHSPTIALSIQRRGTTVAICVADDGVSLSPMQLRRIWEPYQQIDNEFTGQVPGVGLGLTTVAQICWSVGGTCQIVSRPDAPGLIVQLELPLGAEP